MPTDRFLIVNADDFGLSPGVNQGIVQAYEQGMVTSASLMVRWPAAAAAASYARLHPDLSVGLHFDIAEWVYRDDTWVPLYQVVPPNDPVAIADEAARQLGTFRDLVGRDPTHLDSHQHVHRDEPTASVLGETARVLGVPLRQRSPRIQYCGHFYGQTGRGEPLPHGIRLEALVAILDALPLGITELACHPGFGDDLATAYRDERAQEVAVLCDPRAREALGPRRIRLCSYHDVAGPPCSERGPVRRGVLG